MGYGNPVPGRIVLSKASAAAGDFYVTQTFAQHPPSSKGIDVSDGRCGSAVLAMANGTVSAIFRDPSGAKIVRVRLDTGDEQGAAHCDRIVVILGQRVTRGQQIGTIGRTGIATACHLHGGLKRGGVEIDWWPLLDQNATARPAGPGINIRSAPRLAGQYVYALTLSAGWIRRVSDGANLGVTSTWRRFGGWVSGDTYQVGTIRGSTWGRIWLGGAYRYVARPLLRLTA